MILDSSQISLPDGTKKAAIDINPGRELLSFAAGKAARSLVKGRTVEVHPEAVKLILSSGDCLGTSADQLVAVPGKRITWTPASKVPLGAMVRGERAGMPVSMVVIARVRVENQRLVGIETHRSLPFIAEGVLCRS